MHDAIRNVYIPTCATIDLGIGGTFQRVSVVGRRNQVPVRLLVLAATMLPNPNSNAGNHHHLQFHMFHFAVMVMLLLAPM